MLRLSKKKKHVLSMHKIQFLDSHVKGASEGRTLRASHQGRQFWSRWIKSLTWLEKASCVILLPEEMNNKVFCCMTWSMLLFHYLRFLVNSKVQTLLHSMNLFITNWEQQSDNFVNLYSPTVAWDLWFIHGRKQHFNHFCILCILITYSIIMIMHQQ